MTISIVKERRVRFHESKTVREDEPIEMVADSLALPPGFISAPDDVHFRYAPGAAADVYEYWHVSERIPAEMTA